MTKEQEINNRLKGLAVEFIILARLTLISKKEDDYLLVAKGYFEKALQAHNSVDNQKIYNDFLSEYFHNEITEELI